MKYVLAIVILTLSLNSYTQENKDVQIQIKNLIDTSKQEESIVFLNTLLQTDPSTLLDYKSHIKSNLNEAIQKNEFNYSIVLLALNLCQRDLLVLEEASEIKLSALNKSKRQNLKQSEDYQNWIWDDYEYLDGRSDCCLILDLLGYGNSSSSEEELTASLSYFIDTRAKYFAITSLTRRDIKVNNDHFKSVAAQDETRGLLFEFLENIDRLNKFPKKYKNQEFLSKANMVNWLVYPTELGRVPTDIELVEIFTVKYDDVGPTDYYLWKFRSNSDDWSEEGWMTGLSGPFVRSESPTMTAYGYTFSAFSKFEDKTSEEHFDEIVKIIDDWNDANK